MTGDKLHTLIADLMHNQGRGLDEDGDFSYVFVVTISYPEHLYDSHSSFPILPQKRTVAFEELSPFSQDSLCGQKPISCDKLIADFSIRKQYPIHLSYLKLALRLGLHLEEVHSAIQFYQTDFLRPYIEDCMKKRAVSTNEFDRNFFKLKSNAGVCIAIME